MMGAINTCVNSKSLRFSAQRTLRILPYYNDSKTIVLNE